MQTTFVLGGLGPTAAQVALLRLLVRVRSLDLA